MIAEPRKLIVVVCLFAPAFATAAVRYVKPAATGSANCSSWANACTLNTAIDPNNPVAQPGDQVWVKAGTYSPFALLHGVKIIGGFAGTETAASQSSPAANQTIVDGAGFDRCLSAVDTGPGTLLRGFTVRNGYADDYGGGLFVGEAEASFVQCIFEYNTADFVGGAVLVHQFSAVSFINCIFRHNGASGPDEPPYGGGAILQYDATTLTAVNCLFHDNRAYEGGAVQIADDPSADATFTNCTFANNHATYPYRQGPAVHDSLGNGDFHNCIFWGNTRWDGAGHPIYGDPSPGGTIVSYSNVQGGWTGAGNINTDPLFTNYLGSDFVLSCLSPCNDAGSNALLPYDYGDLDWDGKWKEPTPKDLALGARIEDAVVNMGAYELGGLSCE